MTEKEWLACESATNMLEYLKRCRRYHVTARQVLLFGCRSVRRVGKKLVYQESDRAIQVAERFADGQAGPVEMNQARREARYAVGCISEEQGGQSARHAAEAAWCLTRLPNDQTLDRIFLLNTMQEMVACIVRAYWFDLERRQREQVALAGLLREVVGNPFRPVQIDPAWLAWNDRAVVRIADTIYAERHWEEMLVLSDALEEAGCTDTRLLEHCRADTIHCRGCWLLDALLADYHQEKASALRHG